jgi:hypothetical protein
VEEKSQVQSEAVPYAPGPAPCDRITAQFAMHHQTCDVDDPKSCQAVFQYECTTKDEPWSRRIQVTPGRAIFLNQLNSWFESNEQISYIVIKNQMQLGHQVQPTEEERDKFKRSIVKILVGGLPLTELHPGEIIPFRPKCPLENIMLGVEPDLTVPVSITFFPR